jgi:hypothetical protein
MANENGAAYDLPAHIQTAGDDYVTDIIPPYAMQHADTLAQYRVKLQTFLNYLNALPSPESLDRTPDGQAQTVLISHIEMTLDEFFFGMWETYDFKWSVIANEVVGSLILEVIHPVTGQKIKRTGAAAIQIMVDKVPDELQERKEDTPAEKMEKKRARNKWANNPDNKKSSALDMGFPKLKAECTKNAAQSFGKLFGRDLNRGAKADSYKPRQKDRAAAATKETVDLLNKVK